MHSGSRKSSPVIIMGMHRSGTGMISRILERLGLFTGAQKQRDHEALFFLNLNDWLMSQCGGAWDHPQPIHDLIAHGEAKRMALDYIRFIMKTPRVASYMGWKNYLRHGSPERLDFPWGWKDPRNTFTLPFWLEIFPEAKVIHIYRNGVDVANSLCVRERARFNSRVQPIYDSYMKLLYVIRPKKGGFADSLRCSTLEGGFSLWEEYLHEARSQVARLRDRAIEVKYEEFVTNPSETLRCLAKFCGLPENGAAADGIRKTRAYAYKDAPQLGTFAEQVSARLKTYGY